jgi:hypothetical protein
MGKRQSQTGQTLRGREDIHHRVFFPGFSRTLAPDATPQINNYFPAVVDAAGGPQLIAASKVLNERFPHGLKPWLHMIRYSDVCSLHFKRVPTIKETGGTS